MGPWLLCLTFMLVFHATATTLEACWARGVLTARFVETFLKQLASVAGPHAHVGVGLVLCMLQPCRLDRWLWARGVLVP